VAARLDPEVAWRGGRCRSGCVGHALATCPGEPQPKQTPPHLGQFLARWPGRWHEWHVAVVVGAEGRSRDAVSGGGARWWDAGCPESSRCGGGDLDVDGTSEDGGAEESKRPGSEEATRDI